MKKFACSIIILSAFAIFAAGCGGGSTTHFSSVSGTVATFNRDVAVGADVWVNQNKRTKTVISGAYRLDDVQSGWRTVWAEAVIDGETWVGSTAAEILEDEPTMNVNIVLAPEREVISISGVVTDDTGRRVSGARVLLTTRRISPKNETGSFDGPYGSIVAVTGSDGYYILREVPTGYIATIAASKVGFRNNEMEIDTGNAPSRADFSLAPSNLTTSPGAPILEAIESYTMPEVVTRSTAEVNAYRAIRAYTSQRYLKSTAGAKQMTTRAAPAGSMIEVDLYWNALDVNFSYNVAGYAVYRTTSPTIAYRAIDFIRDPYANFYGDTGVEITPAQSYYYKVSTVDVEFLDRFNRTDPAAESNPSNALSIIPLGQLRLSNPANGADVITNPTFTWQSLSGAESYSVYVYDKFPSLPLDPGYDYGNDPIVFQGTFPVWPRKTSPNETTVGSGTTSLAYTGPALQPGRTYYWVVLAKDNQGTGDGYSRIAYSYSQLRSFTAR